MKPSSEIRAMRTEQVAAYRSSGLPAQQFCTENQMNIHTLKYWISKLNRETRDDQEPAYQWVSLSAESAEPSGLQVNVGTVSVQIHPGFDPQLLRQVIQVLLETC